MSAWYTREMSNPYAGRNPTGSDWGSGTYLTGLLRQSAEGAWDWT